MALRTRAAEVLGVELPFVLAPMGRWAEASLAAAVSAGGGLGSFGAWASMGIDEAYVRQQIEQIRSTTDRPFAAGFTTHHIPKSRPQLSAVLELEVPVVLLSFDDPGPWIPMMHEAGSKVVCQVQTYEGAAQAVDAGADVLCVQGSSAGGHTGEASLLPLLIRVVERHPETPVIAAGGITSGRALAAVIAAGGEGAWMGTAFLVALEAGFQQPGLVDAIVSSDGRDTIRSASTDVLFNAWGSDRPPWPRGIALRSRRNALTDEWHGREAELERDKDRISEYLDRFQTMDPDVFPMMYGEGAGEISGQASAANIMASLADEAMTLLRRWT